jgi:ATP-dependent DNA helicase DinG
LTLIWVLLADHPPNPQNQIQERRTRVSAPHYSDFVPPASDTKKRDVSLYQFFAPGGVLSRTHPAYEFRRGQLQMAQAVEQALEEKRHLIVEAGTGTGKTLAYLVPVIRSGKRVIISTGTKNLQEQLFHKDIPFLEANSKSVT